ncbi:MAG: twin-arginine translocation signal domain-containing protein [Aquificae bacterium]|nr:twin-arginine translocation signal domain-containing protein [Aquificota bacterium]
MHLSRRSFLKLSLAAVLTLLLPPKVLAEGFPVRRKPPFYPRRVKPLRRLPAELLSSSHRPEDQKLFV